MYCSHMLLTYKRSFAVRHRLASFPVLGMRLGTGPTLACPKLPIIKCWWSLLLETFSPYGVQCRKTIIPSEAYFLLSEFYSKLSTYMYLLGAKFLVQRDNRH